MLGNLGELAITLSFLASVLATIAYSMDTKQGTAPSGWWKVGNYAYILKGLLILGASAILVHLIMTHQFQYYYVYNYTSKDLLSRYLFSAFYGGQEGSFMLWIIFSFVVGLGLIRWTSHTYRAPVMAVMAFTQLFLLSMILGWDLGSLHIGASPFRTLAEEMTNAPFIQNNPDFVPKDGTGLNDLLKSPWMMIHPPVLFLGFSMMTVPFAFAIAALWREKYQHWVGPAMPWTLGANISLLTAIFLGGYWAYVTLSFGGYWAWDPVENASLVPWLIGTAGIHTMMIQRKNSASQKGSILLAILSYIAVVYETFLTRSGVLSDSSVHSFVDLGLYNQLVLFMVVTAVLGLGMFFYRYKNMPKQNKDFGILSREFMTFAGAMTIFTLGIVILIGTSSPILGRLFVENPTPPDVSFYNDWSMPIAMLMAVLTVLGQYLYWKRHDAESLSNALIYPLLFTSVATLATVITAEIVNLYYIFYLFVAYFALIGNGDVMIRLLRRNPGMIGGTVTHVGFALLLLGIIASSAYNAKMLDQEVRAYNAAIERGEVTDEQGFPVQQKVNMVELKRGEPKVINKRYEVTYKGFSLSNRQRQGQQRYRIQIKDMQSGNSYAMSPKVYPMLSASSGNNVEWSVEPDVRTGLFKDIYMYVSGSSYVEHYNNEHSQNGGPMQQAAAQSQNSETDSRTGSDRKTEDGKGNTADSLKYTEVELERGGNKRVGPYKVDFAGFKRTTGAEIPDNDSVMVAVKADIKITGPASDGSRWEEQVAPLFAIIKRDGKSLTYSPSHQIGQHKVGIQFSDVNPNSGKITLRLLGVEEQVEDEWVLLVAESKPFISIVWLGTFLLMIGFSISIFKRWAVIKKRNKVTSA